MAEDSGDPFRITPRQRKQEDAFSVIDPVPVAKKERPKVNRAIKEAKGPRDAKVKRPRGARSSRGLLVVATMAVCLLALGLGVGYLLGNRSTTSHASIASTVEEERALTEPGLQSLPPGFTGKQILERPSMATAGGQSDQAITELSDTLGKQFGITFKQVAKPSNVPLTSADVKHTLLYQVNSATFSATGKAFSDADRRNMVDTVNGIVKKYGYEPFNVDSFTTGKYADEQARILAFGSADPLGAPFFNITNHGTKRFTDTYSVSVTGASKAQGTSTTMQPPTVSITFSSYPYLKPGTEKQFKAQVLKDYLAAQAIKRMPATAPPG